jgi:hypothetical protein
LPTVSIREASEAFQIFQRYVDRSVNQKVQNACDTMDAFLSEELLKYLKQKKIADYVRWILNCLFFVDFRFFSFYKKFYIRIEMGEKWAEIFKHNFLSGRLIVHPRRLSTFVQTTQTFQR